MEKRISNKGFMLAETCMVILAVSLLASLYLSMKDTEINEIYAFGDAYLAEQSQAMADGEERVFHYEDNTIQFYKNGNVQQARTISFGNRRIIIELGGGRLVYK